MDNKTCEWRLGIDLGSASIGWSAIKLENGGPIGILAVGSRIYPTGLDARTSTSFAAMRSEKARGRVQIDRRAMRQRTLLNTLTRYGLFPPESDVGERTRLKDVNPWELRSRAAAGAVTLFEVGRVFMHLSKHRGFQSNRKIDNGDAKDSAMHNAIVATEKMLSGLTLGQWQYARQLTDEGIKVNRTGRAGSSVYNFYPSRQIVKDEFDRIWNTQTVVYPDVMTAEVRAAIEDDVLFFQRPLRPQKPGKCTFVAAEDRARTCLPSQQQLRIYQTVNHLRIRKRDQLSARPLTRDERDAVVAAVLDSKDVLTWAAARSVVVGKEYKGFVFTHEVENAPKGIEGGSVGWAMAQPSGFGDQWHKLPLRKQDAIVALIDSNLTDEEIAIALTDNYKLTPEQSDYVLTRPLPEGYGHLGATASANILGGLKDGWAGTQPLTYNQAVSAAGYENRDSLIGGELLLRLPRYQAILHGYLDANSRVTNPTVHLGLNQLRAVVNDLITRFSVPSEIVVETARDFGLGKNGREKYIKAQKDNIKTNTALNAELLQLGQKITHGNRERLKLWHMLGKTPTCVYSGMPIPKGSLFSAEWEVDHLLPYSRSIDDTRDNKLLVATAANRFKGNRSPHEAFSASPYGYSWPAIVARAGELGPRQVARFAPGAVEMAAGDHGFIARQLNDTRYFSKAAREYLEPLVGRDNIWSAPGAVTGMLRKHWGLDALLGDNGKNRSDHRHHAIDAAVVGVVSTSLLEHLTELAERFNYPSQEFFAALEVDHVWPTFLKDIRSAVDRATVAHKTDHGVQGALHNATIYSVIAGPDGVTMNGVEHGVPTRCVVQHKIPLTALAGKLHTKGFKNNLIPGHVKIRVLAALAIPPKDHESTADHKTRIEAALRKIGDDKLHPIRRIRVQENMIVIPIFRKGESTATGHKPIRAHKPDGNYCIEFALATSGKWTAGKSVTTFEANSPAFKAFIKSDEYTSRTFGGEPLALRLVKGDTVELTEAGKTSLYVVTKFSTTVMLFPVTVSGLAKEVGASGAKRDLSASSLQNRLPRLVRVTPSGLVFSVGVKTTAGTDLAA